MTISLGPKGYVDILTAAQGPKRRPIRIVTFTGLTAAGGVKNLAFDASRHPLAFIDVNEGKLRPLTEFSDTGNTNGELTQLDTGPSGHTIISVWGDTGPQSSPGA